MNGNKITFKAETEQLIVVLLNGKEVGRIFTPSSNDNDCTIQVCGFDEALDLWGCGLFGEELPLVKGKYGEDRIQCKMKKDIQLKFDMSSALTEIVRDLNFVAQGGDCWRCYSRPCVCENKDGEMPYNVKKSKVIK